MDGDAWGGTEMYHSELAAFVGIPITMTD
jgi:hypothetical protein